MRNLILATLAIATLALVTSAHADPPPDLTLTWDSGEMSSDMSMWKTIISVTGTKVHYTSTYSGRNEGRPGTAPVKGDGVVKDPKRLAAALAALDKLKPSPRPEAEPELRASRLGVRPPHVGTVRVPHRWRSDDPRLHGDGGDQSRDRRRVEARTCAVAVASD